MPAARRLFAFLQVQASPGPFLRWRSASPARRAEADCAAQDALGALLFLRCARRRGGSRRPDRALQGGSRQSRQDLRDVGLWRCRAILRRRYWQGYEVAAVRAPQIVTNSCCSANLQSWRGKFLRAGWSSGNGMKFGGWPVLKPSRRTVQNCGRPTRTYRKKGKVSAGAAQGPGGIPGEKPLETALREVHEETGAIADLITKLGDIKYVYSRSWGDGERVFKIVSFYLMGYRSGRIDQ